MLNLMTSNPNDIVIVDENEPCPYLEGQTARMPLRVPMNKITLREADQRLEQGDRRMGEFIYQTKCPNCIACEPIRLDCRIFEFSRNQRRVLRHGDATLRQQISCLKTDDDRVALFNKHRQKRGLAKNDSPIDLEEYLYGFVKSCFESFEISYWLVDQLACVAVCDLGEQSLSAVYTYYNPDLKSNSVGTYSILKQIEYCQQHQLRHLYLGYYVADSPHMNYKARFVPHERLINGRWKQFA